MLFWVEADTSHSSFPRRRESISQPIRLILRQEMDPRLRGDDEKNGNKRTPHQPFSLNLGTTLLDCPNSVTALMVSSAIAESAFATPVKSPR